MKSAYSQLSAVALALICFCFLLQGAEACTGIRLKGADGTVVSGRTMEWGAFDLKSQIMIVPRGYELTGSTPDGKQGAQWKVKYGFAGLNALNKPDIVDGMNEKGLACGAFYLPGFTEYKEYDPKKADRSIGPLDVVNYILSQFKSVEEVREGMEHIKVVPVTEPSLGFAPPLHFMVTDVSGASIVIEYVNNGELKIYDNVLGIITNSPTFDWHLINLRNYVNLSPVAIPARKIEDLNFAPLGAGSGMLGLPGDFTPPSRFVRATAFSQTARHTRGGLDTVNEVFRILDNFNIGVGSAEGSDIQAGEPLPASTQWTIAADTKNRIYYYHTMYNRRLRQVDLDDIDFTKGGILYLPVDKERTQDIEDRTP
jgi:choloylglycine hydrolase